MNIAEMIRLALVSTGRISPSDHIGIENVTQSGDYARLDVFAYHGRQKKPYVYWNICVDTVRELIHWDESTFHFV